MIRRNATSLKTLSAISLCLMTLAAAPLAYAAASADDARALKEAEVKLAALAREGRDAGVRPAARKAPVKKQVHHVRKKRHAKKPAKGRVKVGMVQATLQPLPAAGVKAQNVTNRHLTPGEVQGILATTRDFSGTDLSGMNLVGMDFSGAKFTRANLQRANLQRADLDETDLELADLAGANLRGASLNQARLRGTRLEASRLDGALWIDKTICRKGSVGTCLE